MTEKPQAAAVTSLSAGRASGQGEGQGGPSFEYRIKPFLTVKNLRCGGDRRKLTWAHLCSKNGQWYFSPHFMSPLISSEWRMTASWLHFMVTFSDRWILVNTGHSCKLILLCDIKEQKKVPKFLIARTTCSALTCNWIKKSVVPQERDVVAGVQDFLLLTFLVLYILKTM